MLVSARPEYLTSVLARCVQGLTYRVYLSFIAKPDR
jgi:hypothetical protein